MLLTTTGPLALSAPKLELCTVTSCVISGLTVATDQQLQPGSMMLAPSNKRLVPPRFGTPFGATPLPTELPWAPTLRKFGAPLPRPAAAVVTPGSTLTNSESIRPPTAS